MNDFIYLGREIKTKEKIAMRKVKTIRVYNLVDSKGNKLSLELGITDVQREDYPWSSADKGYRWRFIGKNIPMPVRSRCWFNGFAEPIMLEWLKGNGWYPRTRVEMCDGSAHVYELPKGNIEADYHQPFDVRNEDAFKRAIKTLWDNSLRITACKLYRYAHGGSLTSAHKAVREIVDEQT